MLNPAHPGRQYVPADGLLTVNQRLPSDASQTMGTVPLMSTPANDCVADKNRADAKIASFERFFICVLLFGRLARILTSMGMNFSIRSLAADVIALLLRLQRPSRNDVKIAD